MGVLYNQGKLIHSGLFSAWLHKLPLSTSSAICSF